VLKGCEGQGKALRDKWQTGVSVVGQRGS